MLAYDEHLKGLKLETGKEAGLGRHTLDIERLAKADWVLTTYETLRDYHFSFGKVHFRVGVYDEAQKMKSMASLMNNAAKCQDLDFTILMTGTPLENSVMDLWTLMDVAWPGFLEQSAKDFAATYGEDPSPEELTALKQRLVGSVQFGRRECPPVMLRRFKSDILTGLPKKIEKPWRVLMSSEQATAYDSVVADQMSRKMPMLQALQRLREVAFHPQLRMPSTRADHERLIATSARFKALFEVLDATSKSGERVLVFVDLREGQRVLAELIKTRYGMRRHPQIINGDTSTKSLKEIKADFQAGNGFDVLLLGPRAAGFGLTLTAANHVVHMNRWWNPAVEDQCSDRVYRLGQDKAVTVHLPIAVHPSLGEKSFDVGLDALLSEKRALSRDIVVPTTLTETDFQQLFATVVAAGAEDGDSLQMLDRMGWRDFEDWTAAQFAKAGFQPNRTPRTRDGGADIILRAPPQARPVVCQCKHRSTAGAPVDESAVQEVVRARTVYERQYPWLRNAHLIAVTNGKFSLGARSLADEENVIIVDRATVNALSATAQGLLTVARGAA